MNGLKINWQFIFLEIQPIAAKRCNMLHPKGMKISKQMISRSVYWVKRPSDSRQKISGQQMVAHTHPLQHFKIVMNVEAKTTKKGSSLGQNQWKTF